MAAGRVVTLLLGLSFGLWDGADAAQMKVANCDKCTFGWTWYDGRCFLFMKVKMTWAKAESFCLSLDGHLASIRSTNEYNFIRQLVRSSSKINAPSWIGGHDSAEEGNWMWTDGSKFLFRHWGRGEPSNSKGIENCMEINLNEQDHVNDTICGVKLPFICARPAKPSYAF